MRGVGEEAGPRLEEVARSPHPAVDQEQIRYSWTRVPLRASVSGRQLHLCFAAPSCGTRLFSLPRAESWFL